MKRVRALACILMCICLCSCGGTNPESINGNTEADKDYIEETAESR